MLSDIGQNILVFWLSLSDCPFEVERLELPSTTVCNIPTYCTGVKCCTNVDTLKRNINYYVFVDTCKYQLTLGIEKLEFSASLFSYEWGREQTIGLFGVFKVR